MGVKFLINSLNGGGAENLTIQLSKAYGGAPILLLEKILDYSIDSVNVNWLASGTLTKGIGKYLMIPLLAKRLSSSVDKDDILVVSLFRAYLVAWLARRFFSGPKYICWVHNDTTHYIKKSLIRFLYKRAFRSSCAVVVNSKKAETDLVEQSLIDGKKLSVMYNFFEPERIQEMMNEPLPGDIVLPSERYFVVLGRLHKTKGQDFLLSVIDQLVVTHPDVHVVFIGAGSEEKSLRLLAKNYDLMDRVHFLGFMRNPYPVIRQSYGLVSCSITEGFGNVLVEALVCGVPVISSDIDSGPREILSPSSSDHTFRTQNPEYAEYGILMPAQSIGDVLEVRRKWVEVLADVLTNTDKLTPYRNIGPDSYDVYSLSQLKSKWDIIINDCSK